MKEFIPEEYRWDSYDDLKEKILRYMETENTWEVKRKELWSKIAVLTPQAFEDTVWSHIEGLMREN
jgi:hypothetical protein